MIEIIRICARKGCEKEFTPKPKGMKQIYCSTSCRTMAYHSTLPAEQKRQWWRDYYYRNLEERQAASREYQRSLCECGQRKEPVDADMCDDCAAMPTVAEALR